MPLGWQNLDDRMSRDVNPQEGPASAPPNDSQTVEPCLSNGSADAHLLPAGVTAAARIGLTDSTMLNYASSRYISGDASQTVELE